MGRGKLVARLEAAQHGGPALDEAVALGLGYQRRTEDPKYADWWNSPWSDPVGIFSWFIMAAPRFTTSVDETLNYLRRAMERHPLWTVQCDWRPDANRSFAKSEITIPSREFPGHAMGKDCVALSLAIAALRHASYCDCGAAKANAA